ncbi:MAG: ABC transporter substrate-binding protein [Chloroflexi bacterium]|nr:ABC transporter substrate-binding protein [Chloroflexota bacterium]
MKRNKWLWILFALVFAVAPLLVSCAPAATAVPQVVKETVVVKETAVVKETVEKVVEVQVTPEPEKELEGTIVISFQSTDKQTWENLALAYMALHPKVNVRVELKPSDGYQEWIRAQFATGAPEASLVNANVVADLINAKKFLDMAPYLDKISPYTGKAWREDMDEGAIRNMTDPIEGRINVLNLETVQVLWFYNKSIFEKVGITDVPTQPTWDQFIGWCQKIKDAGYIPLAIEGSASSFWEMRVGWLMRMYADQYTRHEAELVRCQPGDYCFREGIDDKWVYDPTDPHNDDNNMITFNGVRKMAAFYNKEQTVDSPQWKDLYENLSELLGPMTEPGWIGVTDALPLFLTQQAAIWLDGAWFFTSFEKNIKKLAEGSYGIVEGQPTPTPIPGAAQATVFELGTFNNPSMEGELVDAPARTIEVNIGFWGIPKKDQAQNDLEMDFLMFLTSPEGYGIYLRNKLDEGNLNGGINGPPAVKSAVLPSPYKERFANVKLIGNTEKDTAGTYRSRGLNDYQPMVREWTDLAQQYFQGELTIDEFLTQYEEAMMNLFPQMVTDHLRWEGGMDALKTPEKKPEVIE